MAGLVVLRRGEGLLPAPRALSICAWAWFLRIAIKHRCTSQPPASVCAGGRAGEGRGLGAPPTAAQH